MSTTVTFTPRAIRFSAISSPMNPPPTTTALRQLLFSTYARMPIASSGVRIVNTPGSCVPGTLGTNGVAPVAITSLS